MGSFFHTFLFQPLVAALEFLTNTLPGNDLGVAIIVLTGIIRLLFSPLSLRAARSQRALAILQPQIEALRKEHKDDPNTQTQKIMDLYRKNQVNPLAGCLPLLIQLPILIALYRALWSGLQNMTIDPLFLGFISLHNPNHWLALSAGILQFVQGRVSLANQPGSQSGPAAAMTSQMLYMLPIFVVVISWRLPAGIALYWASATLFSIVEQWYIRRRLTAQSTASNLTHG